MKYFKTTLMILFFVMFLMFAFAAVSIMRNHYLGIYPDKITVEFESSLIYSIYSASLSIVFFQLFYSLYKHKRWQRFVFGIIMLLWEYFILPDNVNGPTLGWSIGSPLNHYYTDGNKIIGLAHTHQELGSNVSAEDKDMATRWDLTNFALYKDFIVPINPYNKESKYSDRAIMTPLINMELINRIKYDQFK